MERQTWMALGVLLTGMGWAGPAAAADPSHLPWHLADVYLDLDHRGPVESLSVRMQLFDDLPADGHGMFLVPVGGKVCGRGFYAGVCSQAFCVGPPGKHTAIDRPGYLYTQFGTKAADRALRAKNGYVMTGDHEGDHVGVRAVATATAGVYTFTLRRRKEPPTMVVKDGEVAIDLLVQRDGDAEPVQVGGLIFPEKEFTVDRLAGFCEVMEGWDPKRGWFRGAKANDPKLIPRFRYAVGDWRVNGKAVAATSVAVVYPQDVPQRAAVGLVGGCKDKDLVGRLDDRLRGEDTVVYAVGANDVSRVGLDEVTLIPTDETDTRRGAHKEVLKRVVPNPVFTPARAVASAGPAKTPTPKLPPLAGPTAEQLRAAKAAVEAAGGGHVEFPQPWHGLSHAFILPKEAGDDALAKLPPVPFPFALVLSGSNVTDAGLKALATQEHLTALLLARTKVTDEGVEELTALKRLRVLSLAGARVTGSGLTGLAGLRKLADLDLSESAVSDAGLQELAGVPALARLNLAGTKVTDAGVKQLGSLPALAFLNLHGTATGDAGVRRLAGLKRLAELDLSDTRVTDAGLEHVGRWGVLTHLNLSGTKVSDAGLKHVGGLTGLTVLDLHSTAVTNAGLGRLVGLAKLDHLYLDRTVVTNAGVTQLVEHLPGCLISR